MVVPRGVVTGAQLVGFVLGMAGAPCVEYGIVGKLRAALLRQAIAVGIYGLTLLALLSSMQGLGLPSTANELGAALAVFAWLAGIAVLLSYVQAYATPRLDPQATLRQLGLGVVAGSALIGACTLDFAMLGGASVGTAVSGGILVAMSFLSAGFAFLIVPLVAPRAGGRGVVEIGAFALLVGLLLASLPRILFLLSISVS